MAIPDDKSVGKFNANDFRGQTGKNFGKAQNEADAMTFAVPNYTTTERDLLDAANGMIIYNTTDNKFQGYENSSWSNII